MVSILDPVGIEGRGEEERGSKYNEMVSPLPPVCFY